MILSVSKIDKLREKFFRKPIPNDITFNELIKLSKSYGLEVVSGGNHPIKIVHKKSGTVIPIPRHGNCVDEAYIKQVRDLLDELDVEH